MSETEDRGFKRRANHNNGVTDTRQAGQRLQSESQRRELLAAAHTSLTWSEQRGRIRVVTLQALERLGALLDGATSPAAVASVVAALLDVHTLASDHADAIRPLASAAICRLQKMAPKADTAEAKHIVGALIDAQRLALAADPPRPASEMTPEEIEAELGNGPQA